MPSLRLKLVAMPGGQVGVDCADIGLAPSPIFEVGERFLAFLNEYWWVVHETDVITIGTVKEVGPARWNTADGKRSAP